MKSSYERHLPHQIPEKHPIFLTWNLKGSMPRHVWRMLQRERRRLKLLPKRIGESPEERTIRENKVIFALADRALDLATDGPMHLRDEAAAKIVEDSILFGVSERYELYAWCVRSNHVHVVLTPAWRLKDITQGIKGYTAHEINALQEARGRVFWQDEPYDHWARDEEELLRIIYYIENNPVVAGLCKEPNDWPWSSARYRATWRPGMPFIKGTSAFPG
jgi:REP element-mobilizing transposase RayT